MGILYLFTSLYFFVAAGLLALTFLAKHWKHPRNTGPLRIARKKALYRSPDGRPAGV